MSERDVSKYDYLFDGKFFNVVYVGNYGNNYDFDNLFKALALLNSQGINGIYMGLEIMPAGAKQLLILKNCIYLLFLRIEHIPLMLKGIFLLSSLFADINGINNQKITDKAHDKNTVDINMHCSPITIKIHNIVSTNGYSNRSSN